MPHVLLLFVDGVGLGEDDRAVNPFVNAAMPVLTDLAGVRALTAGAVRQRPARASLASIDATLGVDGTPQSGTGQATLLTGIDAVAMHGRHFGPWVPARLRGLVRERSVLRRAIDAGFSAAFANAYPEEVLDLIPGTAPRASDAPKRAGRSRRTPSFLRAGPPLAAIGAGLLTRHTPELERGDAVASELTNESWREKLGRRTLPTVSAAEAGRNLGRIAVQHDVTLFAHYTTDYAGHAQDMDACVHALERVDQFAGGLLDYEDELLIMIASDHGNIEDVRTGHTRNSALGMVIGSGHAEVAGRIRSLLDVTPAILDVLSH